MIASAAGNFYVEDRIIGMKTSIEKGDSLTNSANKSGLFTTLVMQMISIGEETGDIDRLLDEVADFYEKELDYDLSKLSSAIEPIMISMIAGMVLILALGIFLPMWDISAAAV